jgi:hypothetical protein
MIQIKDAFFWWRSNKLIYVKTSYSKALLHMFGATEETKVDEQ